jgi:putative oxidoreductase
MNSYDIFLRNLDSHGIPTFLLPVVIVFELVAGASVVLGWRIRLWAFLLAGFCILVSFTHHSFWLEEFPAYFSSRAVFMKNIGLAGGLLLFVRFGAGSLSVDAKFSNNNAKDSGQDTR